MLREFVELKHYKFAEEAPDWREAIRMSCESLEADGTVEGNYKEDIITCVEKYGPYIVIMPEVAMPHSQEHAAGVHKTAIGFMKLNQPVSFDPEDPDKDARLFFTLASCNSDQHLHNMTRLSELLMNEDVVKALLEAEGPDDLIKIQEQYFNK
ncbi:MAG: PTS sugar transporter subunit IIA [Lachnospiraceae bacterium]